MAQSVVGELLQRARAAVVVDLCIGLEQCRPGFPVSILQRLDGRLDRRVGEDIGDHELPSSLSVLAELAIRTRPIVGEPMDQINRDRGGVEQRFLWCSDVVRGCGDDSSVSAAQIIFFLQAKPRYTAAK